MRFLVGLNFLLLVACHSSNTPTAPYADGVFNIAWESSRTVVDSIVASDSAWRYQSSIVNTANGRQIVVLSREGREYYLEFDGDGKLYLVNYISDHSDLDTVAARLTTFYGSPAIADTSSRSPFERRIWRDSHHTDGLDLELLITKKSYSFMARRRR